MDVSEQNLILLIRKGDLQGFKRLFDMYYAMLCGIASGYLNNKQSAEEIVGDVFFKIWENRASLEIHSSVKAYLVKAVRNRCLNFLEQKKIEKYFLKDLPEDIYREDILFTDNATPLSSLITDELENAIDRAIDTLPAECREIFRLSRFENLRYEEIARQKNISVNTVKTQMKIALQKLRQALTPYMMLWVFVIKSQK